MSKNTLSTDFRKVDVDELDEEKYRDEPETTETSNEADQVARREQEVKRLTQSGNNLEALKVALEDPPVKGKDKALKERNYNTVLDVLLRFRAAEVEKAVKALSEDQVDVLMKYIYRGFANPTENSCGILLVWHEKAVVAGGLGSIVRVMTDRKGV